MDYNKLKFFVTVAENLSIPKAAKILQRTRTTVSHEVQKLEEELETKLFERIGKQIVLTQAGQQIFELAQEKLKDIDKHVERVISKEKSIKGLIRLGFCQDFSTPFPLFQILGNFRSKFSSINFEVVTDTSPHLEEQLVNDRLDLALLSQVSKRDRFDTIQLDTSQHVLATSPAYLDEKGPLNSVDSLFGADLIDFDLNFPCIKPWIRKNFEHRLSDLIHKVPAITVPNYVAAKQVIEGGHGIAMLPLYLYKNHTQKGGLIRLMPQMEDVIVWLELAMKKSRKLAENEQVFVKYMKQQKS